MQPFDRLCGANIAKDRAWHEIDSLDAIST